jgi:carbonic anhydrase
VFYSLLSIRCTQTTLKQHPKPAVANPVQHKPPLRGGAGCKPAPARNVTEQVANLLRQETLRSRLQTCSGKKRYGAGCKPVPARNVTEQVANLLRQETLRSRLQTCSDKKRYGAGCKPAPARNVTEQVANLLRQENVAPAERGTGLQTPSGIKTGLQTPSGIETLPPRSGGRGCKPRPA